MPAEVARAAAARADRLVVDASGEPEVVGAVLPMAWLLRADPEEAGALTGTTPDDVVSALAAPRELHARGPEVVVVQAGAEGDVVAWPDGHLVPAHGPERPVDTTGAGDAFVGVLTGLLARGEDLGTASRLASAAAGHTTGHLGGRPTLTESDLRQHRRA